MKDKIVSAVLGFFFAVLVLESALRISGFSLENRGKKSHETPAANVFRIVCFGDSFTYGEGAQAEKSYPAQLEELLNAGSNRETFEVVNKGRPAQNTTQLIDILPLSLDTLQPKIAILLTGGYNLSNYYGYTQYLNGTTFPARMHDQLYRIRVYKLAHHLFGNIKDRITTAGSVRTNIQYNETPARDGAGLSEEYKSCLAMSNDYKNNRKHQEAMKYLERAIRLDPARPEGYDGLGLIFKELGKPDEAMPLFQRAIEVDPLYAAGYTNLGWIYMDRGQHKDALALFEKAITLDPGWGPNYSALASAYQFSGKNDVRREVAAFLAELKKEMHVDNPSLTNTLALIESGKEGSRDVIERWIEHDLDKIITMCREYGVFVIMQDYPHSNLSATLKSIAGKHDVPFVENHALFEKLLQKTPRKELFASDNSHCNASGYGVMAKNMYDQILKIKSQQWPDY